MHTDLGYTSFPPELSSIMSQDKHINGVNPVPGYWQVPGVHARPHKWETDSDFVKQHLNRKQFEIEVQLLDIAHKAGCAPSFTVEEPMTIRLRKHARLPDWLAVSTPAMRRAMAGRVIRQLKALHRVGICHRDLKAPDIVLNGEEPLLVDFELGTVSDPSGPCYDLLGPKASGIALPEVHAVIARLYMPQLINGVWWDSPAGGLWTDLGHLPEVDT
jgi:serine/threonine protein kinase